jgi:uncharacterized DUF497 family protein
MRFWNFDWDEGNIDHIARHGVDIDEVEQALAFKPLIRKGRSDRYFAFGRTQADAIYLSWSKMWEKDGLVSSPLAT